eukprot:g2483.t1
MPRPLKMRLSSEIYTSDGPIRTDSIDFDTVTGYLQKRSKHIHRFQRRYFELLIQSGVLKYYVKEPDGNTEKITKPRGVFKLTEKSSAVEDESDSLVIRLLVFEMKQGTPMKTEGPDSPSVGAFGISAKRLSTVLLKASTATDARRWLSALRSSANYQRLAAAGSGDDEPIESDDEDVGHPATKKVSETVDHGDEQSSNLTTPPSVKRDVKRSSSSSAIGGIFSRITGIDETLRERDELKAQLDTCLKHLRKLSTSTDRLEREKKELETSKTFVENELRRIQESLKSELDKKNGEIVELKKSIERERERHVERDTHFRRELEGIRERVGNLEGGACQGAGCALQ